MAKATSAGPWVRKRAQTRRIKTDLAAAATGAVGWAETAKSGASFASPHGVIKYYASLTLLLSVPTFGATGSNPAHKLHCASLFGLTEITDLFLSETAPSPRSGAELEEHLAKLASKIRSGLQTELEKLDLFPEILRGAVERTVDIAIRLFREAANDPQAIDNKGQIYVELSVNEDFILLILKDKAASRLPTESAIFQELSHDGILKHEMRYVSGNLISVKIPWNYPWSTQMGTRPTTFPAGASYPPIVPSTSQTLLQ